jgi:hypothetical protein
MKIERKGRERKGLRERLRELNRVRKRQGDADKQADNEIDKIQRQSDQRKRYTKECREGDRKIKTERRR